MENQKKMSLFDLTFMAIGGIIGAGIFSMVGTGIATTGRSVALALLVGMVLYTGLNYFGQRFFAFRKKNS